MSDAVLIALVGAIATVVVSALGVVVSLFNGRRGKAIDERNIKIEALANGAMGHAQAANKELAAKIEGLERLVAALDKSSDAATKIAKLAAAPTATNPITEKET